ncbi:MAG TPA: HAD family hydrolase [Rhodoplanes sp.]|nr:HAD family hydrolase [Rhodoplanes sp.]
MLTGDVAPVARAVAEKLGIASYRASVKPADKEAAVSALKGEGRHVAMVGDGIKRRPGARSCRCRLRARHRRRCRRGGGGMTLMRPDPRLVAAAIDIARRTVRKIRQNLFWAFVYNVVGIPLAAMGFLTPTLAGAAMALSSVSVVVNSLWLKRWRPAFAESRECSV